MSSHSQSSGGAAPPLPERRGFFQRFSSWLMAIGLGGCYGGFGAMAVRYLFPAREERRERLFVIELARLGRGDSADFLTPAGDRVIVTRQGEGDTSDDFIALSSTCPHLGCKVHWDARNDRFFCPCHNGSFDPSGKATSGPPAADGKDLSRYRLVVDGGLLYIDVPLRADPIGTKASLG